MAAGALDARHLHSRYDEISPLRQARDIEPVLAMVAPATQDLLDIGCGTGELLERAARQVKGLNRLVGIDLSDERVGIARTKLAALPIESEVHAADIRQSIPPVGTFDCIVMMSVLHWLHPVEADVFRGIGSHANRKGTFVFSTYHPLPDENDLGGTDALVHGALLRMGWSPEAAEAFFADPDHLPISKRTRPKHEIKVLLSPYFEIDRVVDRLAEMRADSAEQYLTYHKATFGTYYAGRFSGEERDLFFEALGAEAMARMARDGHVTAMPVRIWRCTNALEKRIDVV